MKRTFLCVTAAAFLTVSYLPSAASAHPIMYAPKSTTTSETEEIEQEAASPMVPPAIPAINDLPGDLPQFHIPGPQDPEFVNADDIEGLPEDVFICKLF